MEPEKLWDGLWIVPGAFVGWSSKTAVEAANDGQWEQAPVACHGGDAVRMGVRQQKRRSIDSLSPDTPAHDWLRMYVEYGREVAKACGVEVGEVKTADFLKSEPGDHFIWHRDATREEAALTVLIYLSDAADGLEGGETDFLVGDEERTQLQVKPESGMAVAFYPWVAHRGSPVKAGVRYAVQVVYLPKDS